MEKPLISVKFTSEIMIFLLQIVFKNNNDKLSWTGFCRFLYYGIRTQLKKLIHYDKATNSRDLSNPMDLDSNL